MSRKVWFSLFFILTGALSFTSCNSEQSGQTPEPNMPNPAAVYCQEQGMVHEIRTAADGSQTGICILADGTECDEWAYYRGDCPPAELPATPVADMPNPASVYCEQNGGRVDLRQDLAGNVAGMCVFPDGSECDEWAFYRGECQPGNALTTPEPTAANEFASDGWKIYRDDTLSYTFDYPPEAAISQGDDPSQTLTILGPLVDNDNWPMILVSHPTDREEYRPTEGVDLVQWLTEHNLLMTDAQQPAAEVRQEDVQIAGITAVHTRFERSPQSYAFDKYFFAHAGQLYVIVIMHTGDKENWDLYNRFLNSFQFE